MNTCQLLSAEVWHVANSKICTEAVNKTLQTSINESKSVKIQENHGFRGISRKWAFYGRRPISRKMSRPWNRDIGWSLTKMFPAMQYCDVITNPGWLTAAILKIAKSPYLSENRAILIKFGTLQQILTVTWPKIEIFKIQDGGGHQLENQFFGHNSSTDCSEILYEEAQRHADKGYGTKNANV